MRPYTHVQVERHGSVCCVRFRDRKLLEEELEESSAEIARLIDEEGCRQMVLSLGPDDLDCLYSVFLAKLVNLQRRLEAAGGALALAEVSANTREVFRVTSLEKHFRFFPDLETAVRELEKH